MEFLRRVKEMVKDILLNKMKNNKVTIFNLEILRKIKNVDNFLYKRIV